MRSLALTACCLLLLAGDARAQSARRPAGSCDRVGTTSFEFGRTAGNLRGERVRLAANGVLTRRMDGRWVRAARRVSRDTVRAAARVAWSTAFVSLPESPTRPTANPDAARDFIDVRSACGTKRVETVPADAATPFRELMSLLSAVAR